MGNSISNLLGCNSKNTGCIQNCDSNYSVCNSSNIPYNIKKSESVLENNYYEI